MHKVLDTALVISSFANKYVQDTQPWVLFKNNEIQKLTSVISDLLYCVKTVTLLCYPLMPNVCKKIISCFNEEKYLSEDFKNLVDNETICVRTTEFRTPEILFKKIK
jgi:methionyl-tRNA synthetase